MKLTQQGRDYLRAIAITIVVSTLLDVRIAVALTFALATSAAISMLLFIRFARKSLNITISPSSLRGFKGDEQQATISFGSKLSRWMTLHTHSIKMDIGVDAGVQKFSEESMEISFIPKYAGRFSDLKVTLELSDIFRLFSQPALVSHIDFAIDSLPISLLAAPSKPKMLPLSLGERPINARGSGQEFYGIDEYTPFTDSKDILWKRMPRTSDQNLNIKVRAANIPQRVRIGLIETVDRGDNTAKWMDLVCEGIGLLASTFLAMGCEVDILYRTREGIAVSSASNYDELTESLMTASVSQKSGENAAEILDKSDLVVTGLWEMENSVFAALLENKPVLLIQEKAYPMHASRHSVVFSGKENVDLLITLVINR